MSSFNSINPQNLPPLNPQNTQPQFTESSEGNQAETAHQKLLAEIAFFIMLEDRTGNASQPQDSMEAKMQRIANEVASGLASPNMAMKEIKSILKEYQQQVQNSQLGSLPFEKLTQPGNEGLEAQAFLLCHFIERAQSEGILENNPKLLEEAQSLHSNLQQGGINSSEGLQKLSQLTNALNSQLPSAYRYPEPFVF